MSFKTANDPQSKDRFAKIYHAHSEAEIEALRQQTCAFASFIRLQLLRLKKDRGSVAPDALIAIYREGHAQYKLRYQALECVASRATRGSLTIAGAIELFETLLRIIPLLWGSASSPGIRESLGTACRKLQRKCQQLLSQIVVVYAPEFDDVNEHDQILWVKAFAGDELVLTCSWRDMFPAPQVHAGSRTLEPLWLTSSQRSCAAYLRRCYTLRTQAPSVSGYRLRPPLLVAPSGSGKSTMARWLSADLKIPLFGVDSGSWLLAGSRVEKSTLVQLAEFVDANRAGVIFIDEADKFSGGEQWWGAVNQELYQLIDGRLPWSSAKLAKLQRNFFLMAAGTWQSAFRSANQRVGFIPTSDSVSSFIEANLGVPEELAFRFDQPFFIDLPTTAEFAERIAALRAELTLVALSETELQAVAKEAVSSRRGNRWLENYLSALLHGMRETEPPGCEDLPFEIPPLV